MYRSIVAHRDLDGLASAALCSQAFGTHYFRFAGPSDVQSRRVAVGPRDIVCDLPYVRSCGMWFDHHKGNLEDMRGLGIDPASVPGNFALEKSCARVVYSYLEEQGLSLPAHFGPMVEAVDIEDSFDYASVEEWRAATPARVIADAIILPSMEVRERNRLCRKVVQALRSSGIEEASRIQEIRARHAEYVDASGSVMEELRRISKPADDTLEVVVVDLTTEDKTLFAWKDFAQVLYPGAMAVLAVKRLARKNANTSLLCFSMCWTIRQNKAGGGRDISEIMRKLSIGDGHPGASSGRIRCSCPAEAAQLKEETIQNIMGLWHAHGRTERD